MMVSALYLNFQRGLDSSEASVCVHACRAIHRYIQMYQTLKVSVAQRFFSSVATLPLVVTARWALMRKSLRTCLGSEGKSPIIVRGDMAA